MSTRFKSFSRSEPLAAKEIKLGTESSRKENIPVTFNENNIQLDQTHFIDNFLVYIDSLKKIK